MNCRILTAAAVISLSVCSCSVKEDRSVCPCRVEVFPDPRPLGPVDLTFRDEASGEDIVSYQDRSPIAGCLLYEGEVPRSVLRLSVHCGLRRCLTKGSFIIAGSGCQMDSVYVYETLLDARGAETLRDTVRFCKQFATLSLQAASEDFRDHFSFRVRGRCCGVNLYSPRQAVPGEFSCSFASEVRLPRQEGGELLLDIVSAQDSAVAATLPLESYLESSGYDWSALSLEDISMEIDFSRSEVTVCVNDWEEASTFICTI